MTNDVEKLVKLAKNVPETPADREKQRRSFAYGNTAIENPRITREMIDAQAEALKSEPAKRDD